MLALLRNMIVLAGLSLALAGIAGTQAQTNRAPAPLPANADYSNATAPTDWTAPLGIAAHKPVFAGACKACPWGQLAIVAKQALSYYGYDLHICWSCATGIGVRDMGDKVGTQQGFPPETSLFRPYVDRVPEVVPDISATSESALVDAWNGTGQFAADNKKRQNFRLIASVLSAPNYVVIAVAKRSEITDLAQLKTRRNTWVVAAENDPVLAYYGITKAGLEAKGGGLITQGSTSREWRGGADVWIGGAVLINTWEQRMWYEISQMNDLAFLPLDPALIDKLAQSGYERAVMPIGFLRGVERPMRTVSRPGATDIYVRDDAPNDFAYAVAKALDEHHDLFQHQMQAWYYDPATVAKSQIPLHPGAIKYYRERRYLK